MGFIVETLSQKKEISPQSVILKDHGISTEKGTLLTNITLDQKPGASRSLLSLSWNRDKKNPSYLVISDGWWENSVRHGLYFVIDNAQNLFCFIDNYRLPDDEQIFLAFSWGMFNNKFRCNIYINGVNHTSKSFPPPKIKHNEQVALFTDRNASINEQRITSGSSSKWLLVDRYLDYSEIQGIYKSLNQQNKSLNQQNISPTTTTTAPFTRRVLFDEDIFWAMSKENTDFVVSQLKSSGFTTYIPCVWHGGGAFYSEKNNIIDPRLEKRIFERKEDPLEYLVNVAHAAGLEVHPWFTVGHRENDLFPHLALERNRNAFNIHNDEYIRFITNLIKDVISNYNVDGINLDYFRSIDFCLSEDCNSKFRTKYGKNLAIEIQKSRTSASASEMIAKWNSEPLTYILQEINAHKNPNKKGIKISLDAHPLSADLRTQGQLSLDWANLGLIDTIYAMDYRVQPQFEKFTEMRNKLNNPDKIVPLLSLYSIVDDSPFPHSPALISDYFQHLNKININKVAFYHRKQMSSEQMQSFRLWAEQQ